MTPWSLGTLDLDYAFTSIIKLQVPFQVFLNYWDPEGGKTLKHVA